MAIILEKKQKFNLTKKEPAVKSIFAGLGWDAKTSGGSAFDCDVSVFMLGENGKMPGEEYLVFYNNLTGPNDSLKHLGDNRTGAGEGDDEVIEVEFNKIPNSVVQILFAVTIHESEERGQSFGDINNSFIRILDKASSREICKFILGEQFPEADSIIIGRFYRSGSEWEFEAMGSPFSGGLGALVELYS